jgi:hypothetical protein
MVAFLLPHGPFQVTDLALDENCGDHRHVIGKPRQTAHHWAVVLESPSVIDCPPNRYFCGSHKALTGKSRSSWAHKAYGRGARG